jgi:ubiquitin-protein ligase
MNISFDLPKNEQNIKLDSNQIIKAQINQFKLNVDESLRYLSGFEYYPEDNLFMCYVDDCEIEVAYDGNKITKIDCYTDDKISVELNELINTTKSIKDNLIIINQYFYDNDPENEEDASSEVDEKNKKDDAVDEADEDSSSDDATETESNKFNRTSSPVRIRRRLEKVFESDDDSDTDVNINSDVESIKSEDVVLKDVKPLKFDPTIIIIKNIIISEEDIILNNEEDNNYIPSAIIEASLLNNKNSSVYQIVGEINQAIKNIKNVILRPINTIYELFIENRYKTYTFDYSLLIPSNYPYCPPKIMIKSKYNQSFSYALNNCSILNAMKWNPTTSLSNIILGIYNNVEKYELSSIVSSMELNNDKFYNITAQLFELTNTAPLNSTTYEFNFDFLNIQDKHESKGIGYEGPKWDYNSFQKEQAIKLEKTIKLLDEIIPLISSPGVINHIEDTCIIPYIKQYIDGVSIMEVEKNQKYYLNMFRIFNEIYKLEKFNKYFDLEKISIQKSSFKEYPLIYECIPEQIIDDTKLIDKTDYISVMSELAFEDVNIIESRRFKFMEAIKIKHSSMDFARRVQREIMNISTNLPTSKDSSIFFRYDAANISIMKFLIIPNIDTPYAYGCFEFDMYLPADYPNSPHHVEIITTGGGRFRFNPNLYDKGKVCLSLLGTWNGSDGEKWTTDSTILQILLSIQGLIFDKDPWFNEPGYEKDRNNEKGHASNIKYNDPVRFHTLTLAMIGQLINPSFGFEEVIRNHFKLLQNDIYKKLDEWAQISTTKDVFMMNYKKLKELISKL